MSASWATRGMSAQQRFDYYADKSRGPDACWPWKGATNKDGYGKTWVSGKFLQAHRLSWELANGPIPVGLSICHKCDNPPCVNPQHLFTGTTAANMADRNRKGRHAHGARHYRAKLNAEQVVSIRNDTRVGRVIAEEYGIHTETVYGIKNRWSWKHF